MNKLEQIKNSEVYKQVMADSFNGIMYNIDNRDKYNSTEILNIWNSMTPAEKEAVGGIVKGAINFLEGN